MVIQKKREYIKIKLLYFGRKKRLNSSSLIEFLDDGGLKSIRTLGPTFERGGYYYCLVFIYLCDLRQCIFREGEALKSHQRPTFQMTLFKPYSL